jgi:hypothetical protein
VNLSLPWSNDGSGQSTTITTTFVVVVLAALLGLFLLRHFFGDIRLDAGVK